MLLKLLVVNPNSTTSMTDKLEAVVNASCPPGVSHLDVLYLTYVTESISLQQVHYDFFTNTDGPPSINDEPTSHQSAETCMAALRRIDITCYRGFIVACYSAHPLVDILKLLTNKPVVGIFEVSITTCLHILARSKKFGIVSTGHIWERLLTEGVNHFLGVHSAHFAGVQTTGLTAVELHQAPQEEVRVRIRGAVKRLLEANHNQLGAICLGCAAMADLDTIVRETCIEVLGEVEGSGIHIIDGVAAAAQLLPGLV